MWRRGAVAPQSHPSGSSMPLFPRDHRYTSRHFDRIPCIGARRRQPCARSDSTIRPPLDVACSDGGEMLACWRSPRRVLGLERGIGSLFCAVAETVLPIIDAHVRKSWQKAEISVSLQSCFIINKASETVNLLPCKSDAMNL